MDIQTFMGWTDKAATNSDAVIPELRDTMRQIANMTDGTTEHAEGMFSDEDQERRIDEFDVAIGKAVSELATRATESEVSLLVSGVLLGFAVANQVGLQPVTDIQAVEPPQQTE